MALHDIQMYYVTTLSLLLLKQVHEIHETHEHCRAYLNTVELVLACVGNCSWLFTRSS